MTSSPVLKQVGDAGRGGVVSLLLLALVWVHAPPCRGADGSDTRDALEYVPRMVRVGRSPRTRAAVEKGLRFLQTSQLHSGAMSNRYSVAVTSLAGLAILGAGYQPNQEPYGPTLLGCVRYLERCAASGDGFITETEEEYNSRMHGHGYALLFLSEVVGSLQPERERDVSGIIRRGVRVLSKAQNPRTGGWYYGTDSEGKDENSVTVCVVQALRAARNAGIAVDSPMVDRAVRYIQRCYQERDGSFIYSLTTNRTRSTYALSVAALSTLNAAGIYDAPEFKGGIRYLRSSLESVSKPWRAAEEEYEYYANFYAAQVLYQRQGDLWERWFPAVRDHLISRQKSRPTSDKDEAYWKSRFGDEYATAMAVLILEVPLGYLPIFQR